MMVKTCKGCKYRKRCNGRVSRNSSYCNKLRAEGKIEKSFFGFLRYFRGLSVVDAMEKHVEELEKRKQKLDKKLEKQGEKIDES